MILSDDDLVQLTQRVRRSAQVRVLEALAIPFRLRPDGSIVVMRRDLEQPAATAPRPAPKLRLPEPRRLRSAA